jgi:hypothetical protein
MAVTIISSALNVSLLLHGRRTVNRLNCHTRVCYNCLVSPDKFQPLKVSWAVQACSLTFTLLAPSTRPSVEVRWPIAKGEMPHSTRLNSIAPSYMKKSSPLEDTKQVVSRGSCEIKGVSRLNTLWSLMTTLYMSQTPSNPSQVLYIPSKRQSPYASNARKNNTSKPIAQSNAFNRCQTASARLPTASTVQDLLIFALVPSPSVDEDPKLGLLDISEALRFNDGDQLGRISPAAGRLVSGP